MEGNNAFHDGFFQFKLLPRNYMRKWDRLYLFTNSNARLLF